MGTSLLTWPSNRPSAAEADKDLRLLKILKRVLQQVVQTGETFFTITLFGRYLYRYASAYNTFTAKKGYYIET